MPVKKIWCPCGLESSVADWATLVRCSCGIIQKRLGVDAWSVQAAASTTGSTPSGDVAPAEVRKLAERMTVLEGLVGELRRTVIELLRAPATAAPAEQKKGYWR